MVSASQIREQIALLLEHRIDLNSFEDWIVQNTWNIHLSGSASAEELTFAAEECLSEHSSRRMTDKELYTALGTLVTSNTMVASISDAPHFSWHVTSRPSVRVQLVRP